jgi:ADP-ribosyl-[dinitrogen reductase] hydrolase
VEALDVAEQAPDEVCEVVKSLANITTKQENEDKIKLDNGGYVVSTLKAGLYHGLTAESAEQAIIDSVMMGGDTDTLAAVTGCIAGARFGSEVLPDRWVTKLDTTGELEELGAMLLTQSFGITKEASNIVDGGMLDLSQ